MGLEPRIAFVQDALPFVSGAEKVLTAALEQYPQAPVYTLIYNRQAFKDTVISGHPVIPSWINSLPGAARYYKAFLPLLPLAIEDLDLRGYDIVVSLSYAFAHGVLVQPDQLHLSYTMTPLRYAWQTYHESTKRSGVLSRYLLTPWLHYIRLWDLTAAHRVDFFMANSAWIASWIWRAYRKPAQVVYPPVQVDFFKPLTPRQDYYVVCCRLVGYKRVDLIVDAFSRLGFPLRIVGEGPELRRLQKRAGKTIQFLGRLTDKDLAETLGRAKAFVYAAEEDFGIVIAEAQAAGCPVIAYRRGGASEIVLDEQTGVLYPEQSAAAIMEAVRSFERDPARFKPEVVRENALRFSSSRFKQELTDLVNRQWQTFCINQCGS